MKPVSVKVMTGWILALFLVTAIQTAWCDSPPRAGMAAPPISVGEPSGRLDPTWVNHRGQVVLVLYASKESEIPVGTIERVSDWQSRLGPQGLQVVVITEDEKQIPGLNPEIIVARDQDRKTRTAYQISEDREYFMVDRFGRLRRQKINETLVQKALAEYFDPSWIGTSGAWNQTYIVHRGEHLMYLVDSQPDRVNPGATFDIRLIALPTFSSARPGTQIHSPIQVEVKADDTFTQDVYRAELNEEITVSTELLLQVGLKPNAEPGMHVLWVQVTHNHCGFGDCGNFTQTVPVPIWVD